jgi:hypothetical protein
MKSLTFLFAISVFFVFVSMSIFGQNPVNNYESQWKLVEAHIAKGLPKSALDQVNKIYQSARTDKQDAQIIKALLYKMNLQTENTEDNIAISIRELEKEISESQVPVQSILTGILAGVYRSYYQNQRWRLYQRTETSEVKKNDITTWGLADFHYKISQLYLLSLDSEKRLKATRLEPFDAIISKGNVRNLRPTLYDFLAFQALDYFSSDERNLKKPADAFEINSASAFDPAADFIHHKFETKDTSSLEHKALLIYQKLLSFHLEDKQPDALIDTDIHRLQFVKNKSVHPDADQLYFIAMHHLADQYGTAPAAAQAWYSTAEWHEQKGMKYAVNGDTTGRFDRLKATEICEKIIRQNPDTEGGINAANLLNSIKQKVIQFSAESVNVPEKPFRILVEYSNISKVFFRLIKVTEDFKNKLKNHNDLNFKNLISDQAIIRSWEQVLPDTKDYQKHFTEVKVDALPSGEYFLLAATSSNLKDSGTTIGGRMLSISNISYVNRGDDYFVLDRTTGQPLKKAKVQLWNEVYDNKAYNYFLKKDALYITDENGYFQKETRSENNRPGRFQLEITYGNDKLFLDEGQYSIFYGTQLKNTEHQIFLFTDRSIYRPGQTVYYKGISVKNQQLPDEKNVKVSTILQNANQQEVAKAVHYLNDYGTFSGKFQLPLNTLNGEFQIVVDGEKHFSFRVEEYKRPKFYVEFDKIETTYAVHDKVLVKGAAISYSGNSISDAKVKYRVVREPRFIYPWLFKNWYMPIATPQEITHGELLTDADGKFTVAFEAIPDLTINKNLDPVFDYTIYTDVTDLNGETRSSEKPVSVSYKMILVKMSLPASLPADSLKTLDIRVENTNGVFQPGKAQVKILKLKPEQRPIRKRYWQKPDQFVMTKAEFIQTFPHDEYDNETDAAAWETESVVFEKSDSITSAKKFTLSKNKFPPGFYRIEVIVKDKNNEETKVLANIELTDPEGKQNIRPGYLSTEGSRPIEPGEKTTLKIGSSADNLFVIRTVVRQKYADRSDVFSYFKLNKEKRSFSFTATEADRGGYTVIYMFAKDNRFYQFTENIRVPWSNKELNIEYATFRNKTLPGSKETWKVKISGYKKEIVAAEMLASMYDASLDQFYAHHWIKPMVWPAFNNQLSWNSSQNFGFSVSQIRAYAPVAFKNREKRYDEPMGYINFGSVSRALGGRVMGVSVSKGSVVEAAPMMQANAQALSEVVVVGYGQEIKKDEDAPILDIAKAKTTPDQPQTRKKFNETAFFFPDLRTNDKGEIEFSFTIPEALTRWKFQALAHTKELALGYSSKEIVTQKDLMVQPNPPRFLREGDDIILSSKIANLSDQELSGTVSLVLYDTETNAVIDDLFKNIKKKLSFSVAAKQSTSVSFPISVPKNFSKTVTWRIVASAGSFSDGEENTLPVLPNRMLVTETFPLTIRGGNGKSFKFEKLIHSGKSYTLVNQSLTVECTSNPLWYIVQSLPYLMEYPYECAEQTWNRYFANSIASNLVNNTAGISKVLKTWFAKDTTALLSNLDKNPELKSVLMEETPWVLEAKSEAEQKRNIALLFDLTRMSGEMDTNLEKLKQMQGANGGFSWFKGGSDDRYITQYIISNIGRLEKLLMVSAAQSAALKGILDKGIPYLDRKIKDDYDQLVISKMNLAAYIPDPTEIQYLYMRSFFPDYKLPESSKKAFSYFTERSGKTWVSQNKMLQGMIALTFHRSKDFVTSKAIAKSLTETAVRNEELGMYWKSNRSWWWHENPIEQQTLLIEAFREIGSDSKTIDELLTWLLKNKQTNRWENTKTTAEACFALIYSNAQGLSSSPAATVKLGDVTIASRNENQEDGTGYFKKSIEASKILPEMGNIHVSLSNTSQSTGQTSWGAVYWQYFEDLDKITFAETPLKLEKKLFVEKNSDKGPVLIPLNDSSLLAIGDKIKVRIVLRVDRDMEYVHMKDMRASSLEPVNVLSGYKWQGGLGYYESTKDASTNFFFDHLNRGTYVFEYPLFVTHSGSFSNGITSAQCMYAPEFSAHSEGVRIRVKD